MRVLIDTTFAARAPLSGTGVYIERVVEALGELDGVDVVTAANPRRGAAAGGGLGSARNLASDHWWAVAGLPRRARETGAEVIHAPLLAGYPLRASACTGGAPARRGPARVATITDLAFERFPQYFARGYRVHAHLALRAAARASDQIICISQATADDAAAFWRIPRQRITVAPLGPGQELLPAPPEAPRHFLYVGDAEPRKNLGVLLKAYARYRATAGPEPLRLILAGSVQESTAAAADGVSVAPRPDAAALAALLASSAALVHPARHEGFGLTPLEAMRAGTPVIAARSPGVAEVCGDAALLCDPDDVGGFAAAMNRVASDAGLREALRDGGIARAQAFSWGRCARAHLAAYSQALTV